MSDRIDLRLWIAQPDVELDHLGPVGCEHQADVQEAAERMTFRRHPATTGSTMSRMTASRARGSHERTRREGSHAAGVRPPVIVEDSLVILSRANRHSSLRRRTARRMTLQGRSGTPR